ncbi:MAG: phenylacetate--CoA ligase family protein [Planctomycetota bacterium]|jgi:putative adenylate-forming enzyme
MSIVHLLKTIASVRRTKYLNAHDIERVQEERFRKLLRHVWDNSKFYRRHYTEHGITAQDIDSIALKDLPPINKNIMMEHYDDLVCDPALKKEHLERFINNPETIGKNYKDTYKVVHTSGSSGMIGVFVYSPNEWNVARALPLRVSGVRLNPLKRSRVAYIGATDGHFAGIGTTSSVPRIFFKFRAIPINSPLENIRRIADSYQPDILGGYASGVCILAKEQLAGTINIRPRTVCCSGDLLTPKMRATITEAFGVEPNNAYISSESMTMGIECHTGRRIHLNEDYFCFEVVDDKLNAVNHGESGKLVLTNLYNYTQPLIRYQMNDEIILNKKPCQCGSSFSILETIAGRKEDFLWFDKADGTQDYVHPLILVEFFVPGLDKFQFIQTERNTLLMKAVVIGDHKRITKEIMNKMQEILAKKNLDQVVRFSVEIVKELHNDSKTGKFKLVVPFQGN